MRVWAITGGVACGKSTVSKLFAERGARIASADEDARAARSDPEVSARIRAALGTDDPKALAARIYADESARRTLNGIVHPEVRKRMRAAIDAARAEPGEGLLLYEVPLLFEGGLETWFDGTIAELASADVQRARLQARHPGISDEEIERRRAAQLPAEEKARRAELVIRTDVALHETRRQVEEALARILWPKAASSSRPSPEPRQV